MAAEKKVDGSPHDQHTKNYTEVRTPRGAGRPGFSRIFGLARSGLGPNPAEPRLPAGSLKVLRASSAQRSHASHASAKRLLGDSAELKGPRQLSRIGPESAISNRIGAYCWAKPSPKYPAGYPQTGTQRFRTILGRCRRASTTIRSFLNCQITQPSPGPGCTIGPRPSVE